MENITKEIFSQRLKEEIKAKYKNIKEFAATIEHKNISVFTSGIRLPGTILLNKFALAGIDIHYLITGEKIDMEINDRKLAELEKELKELKAEIYDLKKVNEKLIDEKNKLIFENVTINKVINKKLNSS